MTAALAEPVLTPEPAPGAHLGSPSRFARFAPLLTWRWLQTPFLLGMAATLFYDRYTLCKEYLFKYTDEDQAIMWLAAHEALQGKLHEPCFFGQDYNSCIEGYLAAPLIGWGMPYYAAVPLVTVILGLLPFLLLALVAWRRGQSLVAGVCLLIPILMSVRYGIITGIPRGFVTGLAFAIIPAILFLPPPPTIRPRRAGSAGDQPKLAKNRSSSSLARSWPALRYFFATAISIFAIQLNPNCLILLVPAGLYAIFTSYREWKFWVFSAAGLLATIPYLLYVYQFYYIYHDDYRVYLRGRVFTWSFDNFYYFLWQYVAPRGSDSMILSDLVPIHIVGRNAPFFVVAAFAVLGLLLLLRLRIAGFLAGLSGVLFTLVTFAYDRVSDATRGGNSASFPFARMYLAIPVLFVWLLLLVNHKPLLRLSNTPLARWLTRGALAGLLIAGIIAAREKVKALPAIAEYEIQSARVCPPIPVDLIYATARETQRIADAQGADLIAVGGGREKYFAYALPCLTTCDTIYPMMERRTWRLVEEEAPRKHDKVMLLGISGGVPVGGGQFVEALENSAPVAPRAPARQAATQPANFIRGSPPLLTAQLLGRGRAGRGGGRGGAGTARNTQYVPPIEMVATGGQSANDVLRSLGVNVPRVYLAPATPLNPHPQLTVQRGNWPR